MNPAWKLRVLVAFTFASCQVLTSAANCQSGQGPSQPTKSKVAIPQSKSPLKWKPPTYRGLILGKSNKSDVEVGGDSLWGRIVRACLVCMRDHGIEPAPAHNFCYANASSRTSALRAVRGVMLWLQPLQT